MTNIEWADKTPPLGFTEDNFCAVLNGTKTETRRLSNGSDKPKYSVGDRCYLTEPTQIDMFRANYSIQVKYFWHNEDSICKAITQKDLNLIRGRKSGAYSKQIARFMLKSFARYWVEITEVRQERLLDITVEAAIAEGIKTSKNIYGEVGKPYYWDYENHAFSHVDPIQSYLSEIAAIHPTTKDKIGGWDLVNSNPWVWVYKFRLVENSICQN